MTISFLLEEVGANTRACLKNPYDAYDWDPLQNKWIPQNLGKYTQIVPFYPWDRWWENRGASWYSNTGLWGGGGPQNSGGQWNRGVSQDWHTKDNNTGGYLFSDFYQGMGNNYSGQLGVGTFAGITNNAGDPIFRGESPEALLWTGHTASYGAGDKAFAVLGAPYHFYMGLVPGDNAFSYFLQKYIKQEDECDNDEFI